jgi:hypothetical protein
MAQFTIYLGIAITPRDPLTVVELPTASTPWPLNSNLGGSRSCVASWTFGRRNSSASARPVLSIEVFPV